LIRITNYDWSNERDRIKAERHLLDYIKTYRQTEDLYDEILDLRDEILALIESGHKDSYWLRKFLKHLK